MEELKELITNLEMLQRGRAETLSDRINGKQLPTAGDIVQGHKRVEISHQKAISIKGSANIFLSIKTF